MHKLGVFALGLSFLIVSGAAATAGKEVAYAASCNSITGEWDWFTGGRVAIYPDKTIVHSLGNVGTWNCVDPPEGIFALRWSHGGYIDRLTLSEDGLVLAGTNQFGETVIATRSSRFFPRPPCLNRCN